MDFTKTGKYTVAQWMNEWYENVAKIKVRASSHQTYRGYIDNHITPNIGKLPLEKLTTMDLQKFYRKLMTKGRVERIEAENQPKGLSAKTVRNINQVISSAIESIKDLNGNSLTYNRVSDYITIYSTAPLDGIQISYYGKADKYYANEQAIALPGYFPYYPMAGHLQVWDTMSVSYKPITNLPTSSFSVSVNTPLTVYSNLNSEGNNKFSGESSALTLYAGMMTSEK